MTVSDKSDGRHRVKEVSAIDCDIHITLPGQHALLDYLSDHWRDTVEQRGIPDLDSIAYPSNAPLTVRPDWRASEGRPDVISLDQVRSQALDGFGVTRAICNCLYGVQLIHSEDMGAAFCRALNDWITKEWLDQDPRLRASIVVPMQNPEMAVEEIERCAPDRRFVQVLMLLMGDMPLGKRHYWPIYRAAERLNLPVAIHAGSMYRHPVTGVGWPTYCSQDYVAQASAFQTQLTSLICEGVLSKFPDLKIVLSESGFTWLPPYLWRLDKYWTGLRMEVPWLDRPPSDIVRTNIRFSLQPVDAPTDSEHILRVLDHMNSDELLLFSTDYPHWQFDDDPMPAGLSADLIEKIKVDNPLATYPRLHEEFAS